MKKKINDIITSNKRNKLVIATLLPLSDTKYSNEDKIKMWKHLMANMQYLNLEYTTVHLHQEDSTSVAAFLVCLNGNSEKFYNRMNELEKEYKILHYSDISYSGKRINFPSIEASFELDINEEVEEPYNYYSVANWLGKMAVGTSAKMPWRN